MHEPNEPSMEQAILEAAERLFLEKGFALATTTEIARRAGCNQALVHYYFRTKERLFEAVFEKKARMYITALLQIGETELPFEEKMRKKIESHFDMLKENPKMSFLFLNELTTNPVRLTSMVEKYGDLPVSVVSQFQAELDKEFAKGRIRKIEASDLILSILSLNMILFLIMPILKSMTDLTPEQLDQILERRKQENVQMILRRLEP